MCVRKDVTWVLKDAHFWETALRIPQPVLGLPASLGFPGLFLQVLWSSSRTRMQCLFIHSINKH